MIVVDRPGSVRYITQPDHAALAGRLMSHWAADGLPASPRRSEILLAVGGHDNGWRELDRAPFVDEASGQVRDFVTLPAPLRRAVWPRVVGELQDTPYAAALVAEHALVAYRRLRSDPDWAEFFEQMTGLRDRAGMAAGQVTELAAKLTREASWARAAGDPKAAIYELAELLGRLHQAQGWDARFERAQCLMTVGRVHNFTRRPGEAIGPLKEAVRLFDELDQLFGGVGLNDAVAAEEDRALGRADHVKGLLQLLTQRWMLGAVATQDDR